MKPNVRGLLATLKSPILMMLLLSVIAGLLSTLLEMVVSTLHIRSELVLAAPPVSTAFLPKSGPKLMLAIRLMEIGQLIVIILAFILALEPLDKGIMARLLVLTPSKVILFRLGGWMVMI